MSEADIELVERHIETELPQDLKAWLLAVGYGDLDEALSFRSEWFKKVEQGELKGAVVFAQDELGNFYGFLASGAIVFFSRSAPEYAVLASGFASFMAELEARDFKVVQWAGSVPALPYAWDA
ncbi:SMI1/KNR4 family protein [Ideonella sp. DXS29W]|uniref:SMI1/KNR4 family protein n=1 Tax=Ideonella lacteola TaxID=2984193 RepID=A0ABU9BYI9_9BURK